MKDEELDLNSVGLNPIGTVPVPVDAMGAVYETLIGDKQIDPDAPPQPGEYGAFAGKAPIVDPRLS